MLRGIHVLFTNCYTFNLPVKIQTRTMMDKTQKKLFRSRVLAHFEKAAKTMEPPHNHQPEQGLQSANGFIMPERKDMNIQEKLDSICKTIKTIPKIKDRLIETDCIAKLDVACLSIMDYLEPAEILGLLNSLSKILESRAVCTRFYAKSVPHLIQAVRKGHLSDTEKIQLLFYISSLSAKGAPFVNQLQFYLPDLEKLPLFEKIIFASSYYKTSVPLPDRQCKVFREISESECQEMIADTNFFFSLTNTVEIIKPGKAWINELTKAMMKSSLNFKTVTQLLNMYARTLTYEPDLIDQLAKSAFSRLDRKRHSSVGIKNLDSFLWCISYLGFLLNKTEKILLKKVMREKFQKYTRTQNLPVLVNSLLSLHMLRCWDKEIIEICLRKNLFKKAMKNKYWKRSTSLQLLISQLGIELKMKVPTHLQEPIRVGYVVSENIRHIFDNGLSLVERGVASSAMIDFPINSLIIPGITVYTQQGAYHIDVLDESTCFANTQVPHGLMVLKIRLVHHKGYHHLLITSDMLKDPVMGTSEYMAKLMKDCLVYRNATTHLTSSFTI